MVRTAKENRTWSKYVFSKCEIEQFCEHSRRLDWLDDHGMFAVTFLFDGPSSHNSSRGWWPSCLTSNLQTKFITSCHQQIGMCALRLWIQLNHQLLADPSQFSAFFLLFFFYRNIPPSTCKAKDEASHSHLNQKLWHPYRYITIMTMELLSKIKLQDHCHESGIVE